MEVHHQCVLGAFGSSAHHVADIEIRPLRSSHFVAIAPCSQNSYYNKNRNNDI